MTKKIKVTVVGAGYVGMSLAALLAQHNDVTVFDIDPKRVELVNRRESTVADSEIGMFLTNRELSLRATSNREVAYENAHFVIVATPTNYDTRTNQFDTASVDEVVGDVMEKSNGALVVIKSTIPVGHTRSLQDKHNSDRIIFSPEFLREGQALRDNLYPSRIIMGCSEELGGGFVKLLLDAAETANVPILFMPPTEAEAVKLFANTYLAMRVAFFNELDSYAMVAGLDTASIIDGVCLDDRIGTQYNNPSFGYGGYCLPKDTKQLLSNYQDVPQNIIRATVEANSTRKNFIADAVLQKQPKIVGIYRLAMKNGSDNFRASAVKGIIKRIYDSGVKIIIYEPSIKKTMYNNYEVCSNLSEFKRASDIILANRMHDDLRDITEKVFTRDLFGID